jgi:4-hydroxybenzoate polyprenyltransferase
MKDWQKETAWGVLLGAIILAVVLIWGVDGYLALLAIGVLIIVIGYPGISLLLLLLGLGR